MGPGKRNGSGNTSVLVMPLKCVSVSVSFVRLGSSVCLFSSLSSIVTLLATLALVVFIPCESSPGSLDCLGLVGCVGVLDYAAVL